MSILVNMSLVLSPPWAYFQLSLFMSGWRYWFFLFHYFGAFDFFDFFVRLWVLFLFFSVAAVSQ